MDNIFEIIIPIVVAAIYFFGNMFSKGSSDGDSTPSHPSGQDPDVAERQRQIQEEIRRKIMERRQRTEGSSTAPTPPILQRRSVEAGPVQESQTPPPVPRTAPANEGGFSWGASDDAYESNMQAQLKRIEATERQAEKLQSQAAASTSKEKQEWGRAEKRRRHSSVPSFGSVRSSLKSSHAVRRAFIYGEVLGRPVSMQKSSSVPGLERS